MSRGPGGGGGLWRRRKRASAPAILMAGSILLGLAAVAWGARIVPAGPAQRSRRRTRPSATRRPR